MLLRKRSLLSNALIWSNLTFLRPSSLLSSCSLKMALLLQSLPGSWHQPTPPHSMRPKASILAGTAQCIANSSNGLAITDRNPCSRRQALLTAVLLQQLASSTCSTALAQAQIQQQHQQLQLHQQPVRPPLCLGNIQADYDRYAPSYDDLDGGAASQALGFNQLRKELLMKAHGDVLEVGVGTGLNLPLYTWSNITSLTGLDLSAGMLAEAADRVATSIPVAQLQQQQPPPITTPSSSSSGSSSGSSPAAVPVRLVQSDVSSLPLPDSSFDVVLDTFSLCVFPQPSAALAELCRVLRPGGQLLLLEHSRSDNLLLGAYQGATRAVVAATSKGCDWGQDVPALVTAVPGFKVLQLQRHLAGTLVSITAVKQ